MPLLKPSESYRLFLCVLVLNYYSPYHWSVSGNLLQELPKETKGGRWKGTLGGAVTTDLRFYADLIGAFSEYSRWDGPAGLLFPSSAGTGPGICAYFRTTLLEVYGLQTVCFNGNSTLRNLSSLGHIHLFHFLSEGDEDSPALLHNLLIHYRPNRQILVLTRNGTSKEMLMGRLQPELSSNYKWTLGSKESGSEVRVRIEEIYGFATSPDPLSHTIGFWSPANGIQIDVSKKFGLRDFMGNLIRVTSLEAQPVVYLDKDTETGMLEGKGYLPDILRAVSSHLNFTYVLLAPPDKSFGSVNESGIWSGMVGMLQRKEAEMALMSFSLTASRKLAMEFSPPVEYSSTRLLIRRDFKVSELKWEAFLDPFHWTVWTAIPLTLLLGAMCLGVLARFNLLQATTADSAWLLSCCFLQQGLDDHSLFRKLPSRVVLGSFWILAVVLYASYTARLTSFLAATTETLPFRSLAEAVGSRNWKIGVVKGSSFQDRVKESGEPEMKIFSKRLDKDPSRLVSGFREGVERVYSEKFIFFTSDLVPSFMIKGNCSYTWIPGNYFPGFGYMGYQKHLPFAPAISHRVSKLRESGQMRRLVRKWWGNGGSGGCSAGDEFVGMSLYETVTAFLVLLIAVSASLLILSAEKLLFRPEQEDGHAEDHTTLPIQANSQVDHESPANLSSSPTKPIFTYNTGEAGTHPSRELTNTANQARPAAFGALFQRNRRATKGNTVQRLD